MTLSRFLDAQAPVYAQALAELQAGQKRTHWIWYVLPQLRGLGHSQNATHYGLENAAEAAAYLAHPVLGARLRECVRAILAHRRKGASEILGSPDDLTFRSCLTLFRAVSAPGDSLWQEALEQFFVGEPDEATLRLLGNTRFSSSQGARKSVSNKSSPLATAAFVVPALLGGLGLLFAFAVPLTQDDWLGMGLVVPVGGALTLAALVCLGCTIGAFLRSEPNALSTVPLAIPAAGFLGFLLVSLGPAYLENRQVHRTTDLRRRIIADTAFRESFVFSDQLSLKNAGIFKEREVADTLTPDQVRHLWLTWKSIQTGWNFDALILSKNTPPDVLEEYYHTVMDAATRANGRVWPEALLSRDIFLRHPNLPPALLAEMRAFNSPPLLEALNRRSSAVPKATEVNDIESVEK